MPKGGKSQASALFPNPTIHSLLRKNLVRNDRGNTECWREASPSQRSCSTPFAHSADKQMPNFQDIWKNHPNVRGDAPLLDKAAYENQCAINFSAALMRTGVDFRTFRGAWSWQQGATKYPIRAQEVANWVAAGGTRLPISIEKFTGAQAFGRAEGSAGMKNRTGLVFFQNYWGPGMQGDHIDLWNGSRLTDRGSWLRIHARIGSFGIHSILSDVSDMEKAQAVWFWQLA